ncbi:MAG: S-adenosylmethionine hydrolase [Saprospiraceae bacterium]|jgi:S-adenosylmethionine hydrolase
MKILTLTTDFGLKDYYAGMLKGSLLSAHNALNIIDISHSIPNYDIVQAAFVLKNAYPTYPKGTIHLVSVNNFYNNQSAFLVIEHDGHFFIGADNGIFSLVFQDKIEKVVELNYQGTGTGEVNRVFAQAAAELAEGKELEEIGTPLTEIMERITFQPVVKSTQIVGSVIHVDNYENVITNITRGLFEQVSKGRDFNLYFKRHEAINKLSWHYFDVPIGESLCLFNSAGYLEISINLGKASSLLGLNIDDTVQIEFE